MGADQTENTFICPYCCKRITCEGFQVNLNDTGWGIYRHIYHEEHTSHVEEAGRSISTQQDSFILHNPKHMKMVSADLLAQLDPKKIPCPRCRQKIDQAQKLLNKGLCIDLTNVVRICDHCFLKSQTQKNEKNESNFLAAHSKQNQYSKKYNKHWLTNIENELNKAISEFRTQKKPRRTYSDIDIDLLNRDRSGPVIKCTVQEMFHSEVNLLDTNRSEKVQHPKIQLAVERAVNFTEKIETFQTLDSESSIKIDVEKQNQIHVYNEYSRLSPPPSNEKETKNDRQRSLKENIYQEEKHHDEPTESLQYEETTKQKKKGEKMQNDYEKLIPSETEKVIDSDLEAKTSFFFPESFQKPVTKLKQRRVSSSDLIKDTQEKIRLKAKEEEDLRLKLKYELEEKKKLAREEKERLSKEKRKVNEEGIIKTKSSDTTSKTDRTDLLEQKGKMKKGRVEEELEQTRESIKSKENEKSTSEEKKDRIKIDAFKKEPEEKLETTQSDKGKDKSTSLERKRTIKKGEFGEEPDKATSMEQKGKKKKGESEEEPDQKRDTTQLKSKDISTSLEQRGKHKKGEFEEEPDKKRESTQTKGKDISTSLEQRGKPKKGEFEEEPDKKRESTQPKGKDISISLEQKGKPKKSGFEEKPGEKRETKQSKGKDQSDLLEENDKPKKGVFEETSKDKQETTRAKKQDISATLEEKSKMKIGGHKKQLEEKQAILQSKERDISGERKKKENLKEKELKLTEVKLQKQSIDKLGSQLPKMKKNESEKDQGAIQSKKQEEINKLIESSKIKSLKEDGPEEKRDAIQMKSEKPNKKEEMREKHLKMTQVKLAKASADDLGKLAKVTKVNKNIPGTASKSKEPEKILLESANRKEALVDKPPRFEGPKKKDDKSEFVDTKETKERELKMNQMKMVEGSYDDIILKLIRIKSGKKVPTVDDHPSNKFIRVKRSARPKKKKAREGESNLTEEESSVEYKSMEDLNQLKKDKTPLFQPPHRDGQDIVPIYIKHELSEMAIAVPLENVDDAILGVEDRKKVDPEASKGVIRYALSDRTFIEKGWTMLPVEKVVRKMNIYRMRPAQPEFDWFEHNKHKGLMLYDTGTKLAEFDKNGRGRWFYQNGRLALDYYEAEETNTQQRFVVYSNGEQDERGRSRPVTILATFDHLGNGVVFDHAGKIRLKYNQTEGVLLDRSIGPASNWKWHTLNDPPVLQQVMIDTQMPLKDPKILKMGGPADNRTRPDNEEMLAIEFDNFIKEKSKKLTQKFKPFQIRMKALKINENFSLKVLDQATIYLIFRDGSANLKVNIGMILDHKEIVDTDTAELGEVSNSLERLPARTDSLAALQRSVAHARRFERIRTERDRRLRHPEPCLSADELGKAASRPLKPPLRMLPTSPKANIEQCKCSRKQSSSLYYSTQLL